MHFGPVKEAIERFLVFFAQSPPKWFPPFPFGFHHMAKRHNRPAHCSLLGIYGAIIGFSFSPILSPRDEAFYFRGFMVLF